METRRRMAKRRKSRQTGTLTCKKCKTPGQFALYEGGVCKSCYNPEVVHYVPKAPKYNEYRPLGQMPETLEIQAECDRVYAEFGYKTRKAFAADLHVGLSSFTRWKAGFYKADGQRSINAQVRKGLKPFQQVLKMEKKAVA